MSDPDHPLFARLYDPVMAVPERTLLAKHRQYLVSGLSGRVLDLGAGTGGMFPYFADFSEPDFRVVAIEPDPHMRRQARERASELAFDVQIDDACAEHLPYEDDSFDAVVAAFVFCTIPDVEAALSEVARVLRPGGEFRFVEHVRGDGPAGNVHDLLAPAWHAVAGGCHLNRDTGDRLLRDDRFTPTEFSRHDSGLSALVPVVRGTTVRKSDSTLQRLVGAL